jgi:predicted deacetylase
MSKNISKVLIIFLIIIFLIFSIRLLSPKEIDDVSPEIQCSEEYLEKSDILWVIPKFNNKSISENKEWCEYILNLNKTLGLHGVYHNLDEFKINRNQEYLKEGIDAFEACFEFKPEMFKSPNLIISNVNKELIKRNNIKLKGNFNQLIHKVYHCNNTGTFKNWIIDLF